jgi:hypothetical protein
MTQARALEEGLLAHHVGLLASSAIDPSVATARGYRSIVHPADLARLGFKPYQCRVPGLLIPIHDVTGRVALYQNRPDKPRTKAGKSVKYETPSGARMCVDVPPSIRPHLGDPSIRLVVTEGARKADSAVSQGLCCISFLGVWNWRGTNLSGGKMALSCWESIALNGREVILAFDSDVMSNPNVHQALVRLSEFLRSRGASVKYAYLPGELAA